MKNKKFRISDLFYNNRFLMVFSVVAAVLIWLVVAVEFSPEVSVTVKNVPVVVDYTNIKTSFGLDPFGETQYTVDVTVKGKKIVVEADDLADDLNVYANINYVNAEGTYNLHLNCESKSARPEYEIVSLSDDSVDIYFDYMKQKEFTVKPVIEGVSEIVPDGYFTGEFIYPETNVIRVSGPETEVNKIDNIIATASLSEQISHNTTLEAVISAETSDGSALKYTTFNKQNDKIHITVPVYKLAELKTSVSFINKPANYVESVPFKVTVSPEQAVFGVPESKLETMDSFEIASIDFSKLDVGINTFTVSASDITGAVTTDGTEEFKVTVTLDGMDKKIFGIPEEIGFVNGDDGMNAQISDLDFIQITVVGPEDVVANLTDADIALCADLKDVDPTTTGKVTVPVSLMDSSCWILGDYHAEINIS